MQTHAKRFVVCFVLVCFCSTYLFGGTPSTVENKSNTPNAQITDEMLKKAQYEANLSTIETNKKIQEDQELQDRLTLVGIVFLIVGAIYFVGVTSSKKSSDTNL